MFILSETVEYIDYRLKHCFYNIPLNVTASRHISVKNTKSHQRGFLVQMTEILNWLN